jgi:DNA topoisomerase-1
VSYDDMTLGIAVKLLAMPLELGKHPKSGDPVRVGIGRYGPYVVHEGDYRSLTRDDDPLEVTLERALELLAQPKPGRRRTSPVKPLREVGQHPDDGELVAVFEGRYGPYVKHGKMNASLPKGVEPDEVTVAMAVELLQKRRERDAGKKKTTKRAATKKTPKKTPRKTGKKPGKKTGKN